MPRKTIKPPLFCSGTLEANQGKTEYGNTKYRIPRENVTALFNVPPGTNAIEFLVYEEPGPSRVQVKVIRVHRKFDVVVEELGFCEFFTMVEFQDNPVEDKLSTFYIECEYEA